MSSHSHQLAPAKRPAYDDAITSAARLLATARAERDHLAATQGVEAIARAAYVPGGPAVKEIAAHYRRLQDQARRKPRHPQTT